MDFVKTEFPSEGNGIPSSSTTELTDSPSETRSPSSSRKRRRHEERGPILESNERTELLKTLLVQRAQPKERTLTPLQNLFLSFADIVTSFPEVNQIATKQKIFQIITDEEMKLSLEKRQPKEETILEQFDHYV